MIRIALMVGLCLSCARHAASPEDAAFVLPGSFAQQTTMADLQTRFGPANVKRVSVPDDGGGAHAELVLFPDDPTRRAHVAFYDAKALVGVASISVRDAESRWRGKQGVHVGMSFAELRRRNGKPFGFSGFSDQYRGLARDQWSPSLGDDDAQLGTLDVGEDEHMYFGVALGLRGRGKDAPADAYPHDEASVSSDDPHYPRLGELVEVTEIAATTSLDDEWE